MPILIRGLCGCWPVSCPFRYLGHAGGEPAYLPSRNSGELPRDDMKGSIHPAARSRSAYGTQGAHRLRKHNFVSHMMLPDAQRGFVRNPGEKPQNLVMCCNGVKGI